MKRNLLTRRTIALTAGAIVLAILIVAIKVRRHYDEYFTCSVIGGIYTPFNNKCYRKISWNRDSLQKCLNLNRALWNKNGITDYEYLYSDHSFSQWDGHVFRIKITNDSVEAIFDSTDKKSIPIDSYTKTLTINGAFDKIQYAIDDGYSSLQVVFDTTIHFPTIIESEFSDRMTDSRSTIEIYHVWYYQ